MTGEPDRDFLAMMIPHHQGAVDMARRPEHRRDPLARQLAEEIIASQQAEISSVQGRLATLANLDQVGCWLALRPGLSALPCWGWPFQSLPCG